MNSDQTQYREPQQAIPSESPPRMVNNDVTTQGVIRATIPATSPQQDLLPPRNVEPTHSHSLTDATCQPLSSPPSSVSIDDLLDKITVFTLSGLITNPVVAAQTLSIIYSAIHCGVLHEGSMIFTNPLLPWVYASSRWGHGVVSEIYTHPHCVLQLHDRGTCLAYGPYDNYQLPGMWSVNIPHLTQILELDRAINPAKLVIIAHGPLLMIDAHRRRRNFFTDPATDHVVIPIKRSAVSAVILAHAKKNFPLEDRQQFNQHDAKSSGILWVSYGNGTKKALMREKKIDYLYLKTYFKRLEKGVSHLL